IGECVFQLGIAPFAISVRLALRDRRIPIAGNLDGVIWQFAMRARRLRLGSLSHRGLSHHGLSRRFFREESLRVEVAMGAPGLPVVLVTRTNRERQWSTHDHNPTS